MTKKTGSPWLLYLFALPFAGVGLGLLFISIIPSLYEWNQMQKWQPVPATLLWAELKVSRGDDNDSYQALARYQYRIAGEQHTGERVGIMSGSDNVGHWQQQKASQLTRNIGQVITVFVDPDNVSSAVIFRDMRWELVGFKMIFVVVFGGVGVGILWAGLLGARKQKIRAALSDQPKWLREPGWANPIKSNARTGLLVLGFFTLIWNAVSMPLMFVLPGELRSGNTPALIGLIFPLIGVGMLAYLVVKFFRWQRFGHCRLQLNPWPAALGGQVAGYVDTALKQAEINQVRVTLSCLRSYYTGSGKNRKKTEKVIWQKEGIAEQHRIANGTRLSFCFNVPEDLPESELAGSDYHLWRVSFSASLTGADLDLAYEIPVFVTENPTVIARVTSDQHADLFALNEQRLDELMHFEQLPDGVALYFDYLRNPVSCLAGILFGLIFGGAGVFMWNSDAPGFMATLFTLIGTGIILASLYSLLNSYRVKMGARGIYTERRLMGFVISKRLVKPSQIRHLALKRRGSSQIGSKQTEHFVIQAELNDGTSVRVAESLNGRVFAEQALESLALLSGIAREK